MKIGDGGLQGLATHDDVAARQAQEQQQKKPDGTENQVKDRETATLVDKNSLNKAVERLNENTRSHNLPLDFSVKREGGRTVVEMRHTETGKTRDLEPNDLPRIAGDIAASKGFIIDEYF